MQGKELAEKLSTALIQVSEDPRRCAQAHEVANLGGKLIKLHADALVYHRDKQRNEMLFLEFFDSIK